MFRILQICRPCVKLKEQFPFVKRREKINTLRNCQDRTLVGRWCTLIHDRCHRRKPQILCPYSVFGNSRWVATLLFPDVHHSIKGETKKPNKNHSFFIKNKLNNEGRLHYFLNIIFIIMYLIYYLPYKILNDGSCTNSNKVIIDKKTD